MRRGSKGIALIDTRGDRDRLRYVFDVSDTGERAHSRNVNLWELREEHLPAVSAMLSSYYGTEASDSLNVQIEDLATSLAQEYWDNNKHDIHNPRKRRSPLAEQKAQLVSNLEVRQNQGCGHYYDLSIQNQITKQQAKALLYYQQHGFSSVDDFEAFSASVADAKKRRDELSAKITSAEKRMK